MNLLGKATDKEFWLEVGEKDCFKQQVDELKRLYEENKFDNMEVPSIKYSDYKLYWTTGDRDLYEEKYFRKRLLMDSAVMLSLIYPENEEYLNTVMDVLFAICDEYSWCLPAHQKILEVNNNSKIDLFASETGEALAEIYTILSDRLEPLIKNRIVAEIDRRIIKPFTESRDRYDWWEKGNMNWTAVCMGSVGCTIMLMRPELMDSEMLKRFDASMNTFLSGFSKEGMCLEGCGYWHYGFGFFTVFADMVRTFTKGEYDYFKRDDVRRIATFIQKMFLSESSSVSFADGGRTLRYLLGHCHYLKNEYPEDVLVYSPEYSYRYDHCGRWCLHLRCFTWLNEEYYYRPDDNCSYDFFAADAEWFIRRTANYGFCAKGGNNDEHHNHNDVGTFIFAKNGKQILTDLGPGRYCRQYFSSERYDFLETSSKGHNVPVIDGKYQQFGKQFKSCDTKFENGIFSTDIAGAYGIEELKSIKRKFSFTDKTVTVRDDFDTDLDITERFISIIKPEVKGDKIIIEGAEIIYDGKFVPTVSEVKDSREKPVYLIDFKLEKGTKTFEITVK